MVSTSTAARPYSLDVTSAAVEDAFNEVHRDLGSLSEDQDAAAVAALTNEETLRQGATP